MFELPPLILHPFHERVPPAALLENSKAALMLSGLIPNDGSPEEELQRRILTGRYAEIRMLFYLGKDVFRWLDQCAEWAARTPDLDDAGLPDPLTRHSFAALLIASPPEPVKEKLLGWGVADYVSIFSRAIGLNAVFVEPPEFTVLSEEFLRNYHRYADVLYRSYMDAVPHASLDPAIVNFTLYASGEYSRILESEWAAD